MKTSGAESRPCEVPRRLPTYEPVRQLFDCNRFLTLVEFKRLSKISRALKIVTAQRPLNILEESLFESLPEIVDLETSSDRYIANAYAKLRKQVQPELEDVTNSTYLES